MIKIMEYIMDIFFPKKCIICSKTLEAGNTLNLCGNCHKEPFLTFHNPSLPEKRYFDEFYFCLPYIDNVKNAMLNLKFNNQYTLSKTFGYMGSERLKKEDISDIDFVVPVPISLKRYKDRGYNQTELIADYLCSMLNLTIKKDVIQKIKELPPLSSMNKSDRAKSVKGAYKVLDEVCGSTILLVDDIYTTGSTVNECARVLKNKGAKEVRILCICAGVNKFEQRIYRDIVDKNSPKKFFDLF